MVYEFRLTKPALYPLVTDGKLVSAEDRQGYYVDVVTSSAANDPYVLRQAQLQASAAYGGHYSEYVVDLRGLPWKVRG